ncbi:uncharacterized protein FFUJ_14183 [Fusarium fujikuroi IMI 58289]|uniref:Uncharacterized protein n=1 Tax=Gibberella fujikuroi (strain CBS 195.34 / IMI 58289 / NRRL A-6831) TaxID=1279085 RepID=S0EP70_GIBF5|nr:uncharacterized protein FFUJ_14183 [Fusarium fujikuroi IMI 58289]CCT76184.1 uncharacterized protein FFUJ_14183 [Fusarium fujikuroi IMI 58289]SCO26794.1 uncharacterized protein FFM5_15063 [Fusarium fujikuroi]
MTNLSDQDYDLEALHAEMQNAPNYLDPSCQLAAQIREAMVLIRCYELLQQSRAYQASEETIREDVSDVALDRGTDIDASQVSRPLSPPDPSELMGGKETGITADKETTVTGDTIVTEGERNATLGSSSESASTLEQPTIPN